MKTRNNKKSLMVLMVLATISFSSVIAAEEITLPKLVSPIALQEGTQRELSADQIAELLPWAKDSKVFLVDLLENTQSLSSFDQLDRLTEGLKQVVEESSMKNAELLMRYSINRALALNDILNKETNADAVGSVDAKVRVLRASIKMAVKYYDIDLNILTKKSATPFISFGQDYFDFLSELNKSIFDASAQYAIQRTALEWFQWDMYRDVNNTSYAPQIVKINNSLKTFPLKTKSDGQAISYLRQMKSVALQVRGSEAVKNTVTNNLILQTSKVAMNAYEVKAFREEVRNKKFEPLNKGSLVIFKNAIRTVEHLTENNKVILAYDPGKFSQEVANRNEVEKVLTSYGTYRSEDVILFKNTVRKLQYIGEKATLVLAYVPGMYSQNFVENTLASEGVSTYKQLKIGDKVLHNNAVRTIKHLDLNGTVVLSYVPGLYSEEFTSVDNISKITN